MKKGDSVKLFFDEDEEVFIRILEPEQIKVPLGFTSVDEAKEWAQTRLLPTIDECLLDEDQPFKTILKKSINIITGQSH